MGREPETHTPEQLADLLALWRRPGGVLVPAQLRALIAWSGTPAHEREALEASLAATVQEVSARPLAPDQRRGHVSLLGRLRSLFARLRS